MSEKSSIRDFPIESLLSARLLLSPQYTKCPMLIIQGRNDPRVLAVESEEVTENLKANSVDAELLIFEDEGHDVIKFRNKALCYTKITGFFKRHLHP